MQGITDWQGFLEAGAEEAAGEPQAAAPFPREEVPGIIHRAGPCCQHLSGLTDSSPCCRLWTEQSLALLFLPILLLLLGLLAFLFSLES